jgi:beta-aspartyl-peptidase (threonine type)
MGAAGGSGGVVAVDRNGALALPFSTAGMYRGYVRDGMAIHTAICDEPYRSE